MDDSVDRRVRELRERWPDVDASSVPVAGRIGAICIHLARLSEEVFSPHGIRQGEADVLAALWRVGPPHELSPGRIRQNVAVSSGGMTARLDRLEKLALLARRPDPADRRGVLVALTDNGRELIERLVREYLARQTQFINILSKQERAQLARVLNKLTIAAEEADRRKPPLVNRPRMEG